MNVSGVVVKVAPGSFTEVYEALDETDLCEVHFTDQVHTVVVTVEGTDVSEESAKLKAIQAVEHVISAEMVYSYSEDELDFLREGVENNSGAVPRFLADSGADAAQAAYGGDINRLLRQACPD